MRQAKWEDIDDVDDGFDVAVARGVVDDVEETVTLVRTMGRAADQAIRSFPSPGTRTHLRRFRYGRQGVVVHPRPVSGHDTLGASAGMVPSRRRSRSGGPGPRSAPVAARPPEPGPGGRP